MNSPVISAADYATFVETIPAFAGSLECPIGEIRRRSRVLRSVPIPFIHSYRKGPDILLLYALDLPKCPEWLFRGLSVLRDQNNIHIVIAVTGLDIVCPETIASQIMRNCVSQGIGVAIRTKRGVELVVAPRHRIVQRQLSDDAVGHVPEWLTTRLCSTAGFSPSLARSVHLFGRQYSHFRGSRRGGFDDECVVLDAFARRLARGDRRLFFPTDFLNRLRDFERSRENPSKRDHFFHTFNNLFLGFVLLAECFPHRSPDTDPDRIIAADGAILRQHPWETLWALTCLFHDWGYIAESFLSVIDYNYGFSGHLMDGVELDISDSVARQITAAWDTEYASARTDLIDLANNLARRWRPHQFRTASDSRLQEAIRSIYFDGSRFGHSLMSGLVLINRCNGDRAAKNVSYNKEVAMSACSIAALSMVFHDSHARAAFTRVAVPQITFEALPYAGMLAFVDALQEDRRTIEKTCFPRQCVLQDVAVNAERRTVTAKVNLRYARLESWPFKVAEFAEVLEWLSRGSQWHFAINYLSSVGGRQA